MKNLLRISLAAFLSILFVSDPIHAYQAGSMNGMIRKERQYKLVDRKRENLLDRYENCLDATENNEDYSDALRSVMGNESDYDGYIYFSMAKKIHSKIKTLEKDEDDDSGQLEALASAQETLRTNDLYCKLKVSGTSFTAGIIDDIKARPTGTTSCPAASDPGHCIFYQQWLMNVNGMKDVIFNPTCRNQFKVYKVNAAGNGCEQFPVGDGSDGSAIKKVTDYFVCKNDGQDLIRERANRSCRGIERRLAKMDRQLDRLGRDYDRFKEQCGNCDIDEAKKKLAEKYPSSGTFKDENLRAYAPGTGARNVLEPSIPIIGSVVQAWLADRTIGRQTDLMNKYYDKYDPYFANCTTTTNDNCLAPNQALIPPNILMAGMGNMGAGGLNSLGLLNAGLNANLNIGANTGFPITNSTFPYGNTYGFNNNGFYNANPYAYGVNSAVAAQNWQNMIYLQQRNLAMQNTYAGYGAGGIPFNTNGLYNNYLFPNVNAYAGGQFGFGANVSPWAAQSPYAYAGAPGSAFTGLPSGNGMYF